MLTAHGINMLVFWIIFFEIAVLYFAASTLLNAASRPRCWVGFWLMVIGRLSTTTRCCAAIPSVMFVLRADGRAPDVLPRPDPVRGRAPSPASCSSARWSWRAPSAYRHSVPLVTFGAITAAIIAVFTIAAGAIILIPTFLWSVGLVEHIDSLMYRTIWWAFGHSSQQDQRRRARLGLVRGRRDRVRREADVREGEPHAFLLYILFLPARERAPPARRPGAHLELEDLQHELPCTSRCSPPWCTASPCRARSRSRSARRATPGPVRVAAQGALGQPVFSAMFISLIGFGFLGGISGVMMGTEQLNLIIHNTIYVPGHFTTVVVGTTLAFMGLTYFLIPVLFRRGLAFPTMAKYQPYVFGLGMSAVALFLMGAGTLGVPRRHWDIGFAGNAFAYDFPARRG